jgi:hypothetical protein
VTAPAWFDALPVPQRRQVMNWMHGHARRPEWLDPSIQPPRRTLSSPASESVDDYVKRLVVTKQADKAATARRAAESKVEAAMRTRMDLRNLPALEPLVDGFLYLDTVARLVGPPGSYKSFLALDWAASVVTGTAWHGQAVAQGTAVYLVGEGVRGIDARLTAWERHRHGGVPADLDVFDGIVDLAAPAEDTAEWVALTRMLMHLRPSLVVVDTQARYTPGHEENSSTDMGVLVNNLDTIRRQTGACVLLVHHTTRGTEHARGSTAIEGGVQTELVMSPGKKGIVKLKTEKQKDIEEPDAIELHAVPVEGTSSIVLDSADLGIDPLDLPAPPRVNAASPIHERLARVMFETFDHGTSGATKAEAKIALQGDPDLKIVAEARNAGKRFSEAWSKLEEGGHLDRIGGRDKYKITAAYAAELDLGGVS